MHVYALPGTLTPGSPETEAYLPTVWGSAHRPQSPDPYDFALVAMLGLLGLRIFGATAADIA